jgi:CRISPR/Cas system-associated endonuclease Cas1
MRAQGSAAPQGIHVASGFGLKVFVQRGHLIVHQGVGRGRSTERFNRATSKLNRLIVIGHTGFVTLEALRWIRDVGAAFVQIDGDSNVVAMSAAEWQSSARELRRAQVLAAESDIRRQELARLLQGKLIEQARLSAEFVEHGQPHRGLRAGPPDPQGEILAQIPELERAKTMGELRSAEAIAGR